MLIVDPLLGTLEQFVIGTLTAGDQEVVQAPGAVQDEAGLTVVNTAYATGKFGTQTVTSEPDVAYYKTGASNVVPNPELTFDKNIHYNGVQYVSGHASSKPTTAAYY